VLSATSIFLFSLLFAPERGIIGRLYAETRLRVRIVREHLLRGLYELSEPHLPETPSVEEQQITERRAWSKPVLHWMLRRLESQKLIDRMNGHIQLTPAGLAAAAEVTRTHRLWEMFLVESAGIASDHVDRDADDVEHMLPQHLIRELEQRLAASGRLPNVSRNVPTSPHELARRSDGKGR
jgi:manganese/zinc/iron transport system permease protein